MRHLQWPILLQIGLASAVAAQTPATPQSRLLDALRANRLPLTMTDGRPAGAGWDWLVREAGGARFTLIGEEHGVAETAQLSAALFAALRGSGYSRMAIEMSPILAQDVEAAARYRGLQGITDFLSAPGTFTLYNLREEARFLADVVSAGPREGRVLWGLDREIFSDRYLISRLGARVPPKARDAFNRLNQASLNAGARNRQTGNPDDLFFLAEDPALVSAVRAAWPDADAESVAIMRTIEESLAIEAAERGGGAWPYLQRRAAWARSNLMELLRADRERKPPPRILLRLGYNHMVRGANYFNLFDVGAMADEVAALGGDRAFHVLVLPGPGSTQAALGAGGFSSVSSDQVDELNAGDQRLARVLSNPGASGHEVIDLRPLRQLAMRGLESWNPDLIRTIHGFDAVVIWKGAHASSAL
jgi:hypothetical protein